MASRSQREEARITSNCRREKNCCPERSSLFSSAELAGAEQGPWRVQEHTALSDASAVSVLRERVIALAAEAGAAGDTLSDIQIAVGEALTNAYRHGSPAQGDSLIMLRCLTCPRAVIVEIQDEGAPFDPDAASDPDFSALCDHGMGIYLIKRLMDRVEFHSDGSGNKVRMVKWLKA